jgi:hypothetical protein
MLIVILLSVTKMTVMVSVTIENVVMLSVVAPQNGPNKLQQKRTSWSNGPTGLSGVVGNRDISRKKNLMEKIVVFFLWFSHTKIIFGHIGLIRY